MINVLYICTDWYSIGGSTGSLVNLISATRNTVSPIVLIHQHGEVEDYIQKLGIETIVSPFFFLWEKPKRLFTALHHPLRTAFYRRLTMNKKCCEDVVRQLNGRTIGIVHSNTSVSDIGVSLAKQLDAKHVWHVRESLSMLDIYPYGGEKRLHNLINKADARIIISNALADRWRLIDENTYIVHDAVFKKMPALCDTPRKRMVLFCAAQINDFKGAPMAVEAFCQAGLEGYRLVFAGNCDNGYQKRLMDIAHKYGKEEAIEFVGYKSDLEPLFRLASAFLMCSRFEGLGRVTVEAMAYGCPVVARAEGGTTDFIKHGETGYLFNDMAECVEALKLAVLHDSEIVRAAYNLVSVEFTEIIYGTCITDIYKRCLQ